MPGQGHCHPRCVFSGAGGGCASSIPSKSFSARKTDHSFQMRSVTVMSFHRETQKSLKTGRFCVYSQPHAHRTQNTHSINLRRQSRSKTTLNKIVWRRKSQLVRPLFRTFWLSFWAPAPALRKNAGKVRRSSCSQLRSIHGKLHLGWLSLLITMRSLWNWLEKNS